MLGKVTEILTKYLTIFVESSRFRNLARSFGFVGMSNCEDLRPFNIYCCDEKIPKTIMHISWLGLILRYRDVDPIRLVQGELRMMWVWRPPWKIRYVKV